MATRWFLRGPSSMTVTEVPTPAAEAVTQRLQSARRATDRMHRGQLQAIETLFGRPLANVLREALEDVSENVGEAEYHLGRLQQEHTDALANHGRIIDSGHGEILRLRDLLRTACEVTEERNRRSGGKPPPAWVAEARALLGDVVEAEILDEEAAPEEPF